MKHAYIVSAYRTAVGKAPKGSLKNVSPSALSAPVIKKILSEIKIDPNLINDVLVGNAMPEAEQGLNVGRLISLMGLNTKHVSGATLNRYCASGSETIATAIAKIQSGMADCIIAGGVESMSFVPMSGYKPAPDYNLVKEGHTDYYFGMGLTAEAVAKKYNVGREDQDDFAFKSHQKAIKAQKEGAFSDQIVDLEVENTFINAQGAKETTKQIFNVDEGPRNDTSIEKLSKLKPVFQAGGSVTAGNSSQTSDGAAYTLVCSEDFVKQHNLKPLARLISYSTAGVEPIYMGIGPVEAVPKALKQAGLKLDDIDLIELNEAFAAQSLAVIRELKLNPEIVNVNGGAIALGHPLGCSGAKLTVQILNELKKRKLKYGMVTMCVGVGQGAASVFELM